MLIEFTVGNYKSIKDKVTLSMVAANIAAENPSVDENNVFVVDKKLTLLKSAAIYGANASGKSNVLNALIFMLGFLRNISVNSQSSDRIGVECFRLSSETIGKPSFFELVFLRENVKYRYGFELTSKKIEREWLFHTPSKREAALFSREGQTFKISPAFKEANQLGDKTRENALFLPVVAQFNGAISRAIMEQIELWRSIKGIDELGMKIFSESLFADEPELRSTYIKFVKNFDTGIESINVGNVVGKPVPIDSRVFIPESKQRFKVVDIYAEPQMQEYEGLLTEHKKYENGKAVGVEHFTLDEHESLGTQKIFALGGFVPLMLFLGRPLIIDEFDARLHPIITRKIVELFNSKETNPKGAQLIIATHDTNLLDKEIFRRDQIWFTEKDKFGSTQLYSLVEFKPRNDASFEKNYIHGKYGAIPFVGDLSRIVGGAHGEAKK